MLEALLPWGSFQHAFKCKHEAILDILDFLKCGWILLLALVAVLQRSLLKTPLPPSKQKIPGTCLRNNNNLHVANVWFCTKLHTVTFQEKKLLCTFVQSCKVSVRALKYEFGFCRLQKGCGCGGACLTVLGSFLMSSFSICWVFNMSEK